MSEAIISRASFSDGGISDETKASVGLTSDATLDDVLQVLALRSDEYGTIQVTALNPDNTPISGIRIQSEDTSGNILNYTTDENGKVVFRTNAGQITIKDFEFPNYFDISKFNDIVVDCPVGSVKTINVKRQYVYINGQNISITSNQNIKMSNFIKSAEVTVKGAGGGSSTIGGINIGIRYKVGEFCNVMNTSYSVDSHIGGSGAINTKIINFNEDTINISIGKGGLMGSASDTIYVNDTTPVSTLNSIRSSNIVAKSGGSGGTTTFGSLLSAIGGSGATSSYSPPTNTGGSLGGSRNNTVRTSWSYGGYVADEPGYAYRWSTLRVYVTSYNGNDGICWLNNIQYK